MEPNMQAITEYMFIDSDPYKSDLAIIFGTRHKKPVDVFIDLYNRGLVRKVLITGGINRITGRNEADDLSKELEVAGVDRNDIILEKTSINSLENVVFSKNVIEKEIGFKNIKHIIYITKHYHAKRALLTLKKHFPNNVTFHSVLYSLLDFDKGNWFNNEEGKKKILGEYEKIKKYQEKCDLSLC